ncbi:bifunctional tetrahydrofolate synthase/dihydrofolate synthase [Polynucleobacter rarus]|uniref:bifunctional tetrahydrofolate synthase/dihydrofolate synthase n=1 Tax=Polynucleobacter rarus TaxID=556055 RepID=UPI001FE907D2|nr:bifunctional tetrahydrofolate synthase/dihydrofolate synthase [Polynucleobacter rarus]
MNAVTPMYFDDLDAWLSYLESAHPVGIDMGLSRINQVKEKLDLQFKIPVIIVGGTNGKGSTCAFLEAIFANAGYKVACHTSPHLSVFNERARINLENVSSETLLKYFQLVEQARASIAPEVTLTYFEFTTLAIMLCFSMAPVDVVILEVGLGGRLDAVNIIDADCSIVTSIDIDHQQFLGNTREEIGFEKAGIFRTGKPAICADPMPPKSLIEYAKSIGADFWQPGVDFNFQGDQQQWAWNGRGKRFSGLGYPALRGANQLLNASGVLAALCALRDKLPVSVQSIRNGFAMVELPGRFQIIPGQPTIVLDVAHNPHASATLSKSLDKMGYFPYTYAIFGMMQDKDINAVIKPMLEIVDFWYCVDLPTPRAASAVYLSQRLRDLGVKDSDISGVEVFNSPATAYAKSLIQVSQNDRIVVFGSFFTVSGVLEFRKNKKH